MGAFAGLFINQHWWFSGKIGRCHSISLISDVGQPRVRFPADAFFCLLLGHIVRSMPSLPLGLLIAVQVGEH
jgi:hypothetical protein